MVTKDEISEIVTAAQAENIDGTNDITERDPSVIHDEETVIEETTTEVEKSADKGDGDELTEKKAKKKSFFNLKGIFSGKIISIEFILRRWRTLSVIFFVLMFYISNRYSCQQSIAEISVLRREVEEIGYKSLDMFSRLKNLQREDYILKRIGEEGINLSYPDIPPYIITYKADETE